MPRLRIPFAAACLLGALLCAANGQDEQDPGIDWIPQSLTDWQNWVLWGQKEIEAPPAYDESSKRMPFWPGTVVIDAQAEGGRFAVNARVFSEGFFPLPGDSDLWPQNVQVGGRAVPVLERNGKPAVKLAPGDHQIEGLVPWSRIPQRLRLPSEYGVLRLTLRGEPVEQPVWDPSGFLWLDRSAREEDAAEDSISTKLYALLEDGIPIWWRGEIELVVSGRSREEVLGNVVPEGWELAAVESPIPAIIDETGVLKAQVRAGRWILKLSAFRIDDPREIRFPGQNPAAAPDILLGFRAKPDFRILEIEGAPAVDVSQTTYPKAWRSFPVYLWKISEPLKLVQQMRGMGNQRPPGLRISREWWLDERGKTFTFRDQVNGELQETWRLDAARGMDLGSVREEGQPLLVTRNPVDGAPGVEIRTRNPNLTATGRLDRQSQLPASGWKADAESLNITLNMPPGWRLLAAFGADSVDGDWLTQWTLLDLFLLLVFTLAVNRLAGPGAAVLAFATFALTLQERAAPIWLWILLLAPLALQPSVPGGLARRLVLTLKWFCIVALVLVLAPFVSAQVQQALYPQLEKVGRDIPGPVAAVQSRTQVEAEAAAVVLEEAPTESDSYRQQALKTFAGGWGKGTASVGVSQKANLMFEADARIQTGPGVPDWTWRQAFIRWSGPVSPSQDLRLVLVPMPVERAISLLRVVLVVGLGYVLLRKRPAK